MTYGVVRVWRAYYGSMTYRSAKFVIQREPSFLSILPNPTLTQSSLGFKPTWHLQNGGSVWRPNGQARPAREGATPHAHCWHSSEMPIFSPFL